MNYRSEKIIFIIAAIVMALVFSFFFFKMFTLQDSVLILSEEDSQQNQDSEINEEINLEVLESNKFINLRGEGSGSTTFKAGRRNPFEPYE